jgi:hypothetical protein
MEEDEDNYKSVLQPLIVEVVVEVSKRPHLETQVALGVSEEEVEPPSQTSRSLENSCFPYVFHRLVVSCKFHSICFTKFVRQI